MRNNEEQVHCTYTLSYLCFQKSFVAVLGTLHERVLGIRKKKFAADAAKFCAPHGSCGEPPSHTLCFFGQFLTEGTQVKSGSVTQTEVEL